MRKKSSSMHYLLDFVSFGAVVVFAVYMDWTTKDLLWSLWISSLSIGYFILVSGFLGNVLRGNSPDHQPGEKGEKGPPGPLLAVFFMIPITAIFGFSKVTFYFGLLAVVSILAAVIKYKILETDSIVIKYILHLFMNIPGALFMIAFFTIHFGGFHFVHSIFLNGFFPILEGDLFGKTPGETGFFFFDLIELCFRNYWLFIVASIASGLQDIIQILKGQKGDFMLEPYKNVIRMHLMIFIIAFSGALGVHQYLLYVVLVLYFFPVRKIAKDMREPGI